MNTISNQMGVVKLLAALGALAFSGLVNAQAYLVCGSVACGSHSPAVFGGATGINNLNVGGELFDVRFTGSTAPATSPFVLSNSTAAPGQPLTGIDAGNAISDFYGSLPPPYGDYPIVGDEGPAFITAFGPAGSLSSEFNGSTQLFDIVVPIVGVTYRNVAEYGLYPGSTDIFYNAEGFEFGSDDGGPYYTTWTPHVTTLLAALLKEVKGVGPGQSLANKVTAVQAYYAASDTQATCAMLTGFVDEVQAQDGKKINSTLDAKLIADAQAIETRIGCN